MSDTACFKCGTALAVQTEKCWFYSWEEQPSKEMVESALEKDDFRDWFQENYILCESCHRDVQTFIQGGQCH